jgi:5'-nucleotidase
VRQAVQRWDRDNAGDGSLLIGEVPLIGHRLVELVQVQADEAEPLLEALHRLQVASAQEKTMKIRTALVTARSAPAHERAVHTLMEWKIGVDEAMFLGGLDKGEFLRAFEPDFYFDDQRGHVDAARAFVAAGHVPFGVANLR